MTSEIAFVRGHLEGYADALEQNYATNDREVLVIALRDDARRLRTLEPSPEPKDTAPERPPCNCGCADQVIDHDTLRDTAPAHPLEER